MRKNGKLRRLLSMILAVAVVLSAVPWAVFAADGDTGATYTKITTAEELTDGQYVMVVSTGYAPLVYDNGWVTSAQPVVDGDTVTDAQGAVWTITVTDSGVTLTDSSGTSIKPKSGNTNGIQSGEYSWAVTCEDGAFTFSGQGSDTTILANNKGENKFRAYKTITVSGNPNGYPSVFTLYKLAENSEDQDPTEQTTEATTEATTAPTEPEVTGTTATLVTDASTLAAGDQIVIVATNQDYALSTTQNNNNRGRTEITKSEDGTTVTFGEDTQIITLETGVVEGTFGFNADGKYLYAASSSSNHLKSKDTLDENGSWLLEIAENGVATVKAQGSNTKNWLRHNNSSGLFSCYASGQQDISIYKLVREGVEEEEPEDPDTPTEPAIADGKYVLWVGGEYNKALSNNYPNGSFYNAGVDVTMTDGKLSGYGTTEIWTITNNDDGTITISMDGQNLGMAESYASFSLGAVNDKWTLEASGDGRYYVKNVGREQYIQWRADSYNYFSGYYLTKNDNFAINFTPAEEAAAPADGIADGSYVIWAPAYNMALANNFNSSGYQLGTAVTPVDDTVTGYTATDVWTVTNNDDGTITITQGDAVFGVASSGQKTVANAEGDYAKWKVTLLDSGDVYLVNQGSGLYLEWFASYNDWSTYSFKEENVGMYTLRFTPVELVYATDATIVQDIAQWSGMTSPENTSSVYGDKYLSGDELDTEAVYTAVVSGSAVAPYVVGGNSDAPLYYMGGKGLGSGSDDYIQLSVNTAGWGDMTLAFRMKASGTGADDYQLCYSTDNGATWTNFTTGTYSYAYTRYTSSGSYTVSDTGTVTNGVASPGLAAYATTSSVSTYYASFSFDVPAGAENCENLLIRLVPGAESVRAGLNSKYAGEAPSSTGTLRLDSVVLSGSPIVDDSITAYVTVDPDGSEDQPVGTALTMESEAGATIYYRVNGGEWQIYDPENKPALESLPCDVEAYAVAEGKAQSVTLLYHYAAGTVAAVKMDPNGGGVYIPADGYETITLTCATEDAVIYYMTSADGEVWPEEWTVYTDPLALADGFGTLYVKAYAVKEGFTDSAVTSRTFTERESTRYSIFFGQLHSHTSYSDGAGTAEEAFSSAMNEVENLDFLAVTDHSNSFGSDTATITDGSSSSEWVEGRALADQYTVDGEFVSLFGYEMTWSNGLGHINTFNTDGYQSRTQDAYKNYSTALKNYYDTLTTVPESISQFNHPGTTFGDFQTFGYYTEEYDELITLIEVGNGEGEIGSSGYFRSYDYYTQALDKGWHVAPTNNQDNHKGLWGSANTARSVVLADSLTRDAIYDAMRNYRVYATEDNDLSIYYTLDGQIMGSQLSIESGEEITLTVELSDPTDASIGKVEVIVNGGLTAASTTVSGNEETVTFTLDNNYSYYYIKVTQADGNIAVTAPVWTGEVEACGISSFSTDAALPVQNQELDLTLDLYNNENVDLLIDSIVFTIDDQVIHTATGLTKVGSLDTASYTFSYSHSGLGQTEIYATVTGTLNGVTKVYKEKLDLTFVTASMVTRVVVDGTHYNDYVTGYYSGNMGNLIAIAAESQIEVNVVTDQITADILANCDLLIISAPNTRTGESYPLSAFEDDFVALVVDYVANGGSVILCGLADYQDQQNDGVHETSVQLNKLLEAMGSTMRVNDDEAYDEVNYTGNYKFRVNPTYPDCFNTDSEWVAGVVEGQVYSQYSGCTVDPGEGTWLVKGFDTTYSIDSDKDGKGGVGKGEAVFLAVEETSAGGNIFVSGGVFVSDFEVSAEMDNIWDLPYANRTIIENILGAVRVELPLSTIAQVRAAEQDEVFRIRGYVTAGTDNENTTFFDAIYVQDETGGITVFPFSQSGVAIGTPIEIIGYVDEYQGDKEIQVMSYTILDAEPYIYQPEEMSNADAMDYANNGGQLIQVQGEVVEVLYSGETGVAQFVVKDENGDLAKVFIDGYILSATTGTNELASIVKVGNEVSAVGLLYWHPEGDNTEGVAVLRVRNCDEVLLLKEAEEEPEVDPTEPPETDPTEPPETDPTEPPETDPTEPPETDPTEPPETDPTEPPETDPTEPPETEPPEPPVTDPTEPPVTDPTEPPETDPTEPPVTDPTEPPVTDPTEPPETDPTEPSGTEPSETTEPTETTAPEGTTEATESTGSTTEPSTGSNSDTGDNAVILLPMVLMFAALAALAVVLVNRKRFL